MPRFYLADTLPEERAALRLVLLALNREVIDEAADWLTKLTDTPATRLDTPAVSWDLLPIDLGVRALVKLRVSCPNEVVIVLISIMDVCQQTALSGGADMFIRKSAAPERVAAREFATI